MKTIRVLFLAIVLVPMILVAQDTTKTTSDFQTIGSSSEKNDKTKISGFGTVSMDFGQFNNKFGMNFGIEGAMLINNSFYIGLYSKGLMHLDVYDFNLFDSGIGAVHYNTLNNGNIESVELLNASTLRSMIGTVGFSFGGFK